MFRSLLFAFLSLANVSGFSDSNLCRYSDPYLGHCRHDEVNVTVKYPMIKPELCSTECVFDNDCPLNICSFITAKPKCILENVLGERFCGFPCDLRENFPCSTDEYMICLPTSLTNGFCAYLR
jgi:hypothetical protein